jgi:Flp pilus assembly pilin Flp
MHPRTSADPVVRRAGEQTKDASTTEREMTMKSLVLRFLNEDQGQDLIEYALLATFVSLVAIAGATLLGTALNQWYNAVNSRVVTASGTAAS